MSKMLLVIGLDQGVCAWSEWLFEAVHPFNVHMIAMRTMDSICCIHMYTFGKSLVCEWFQEQTNQ